MFLNEAQENIFDKFYKFSTSKNLTRKKKMKTKCINKKCVVYDCIV